MILFGEFEQHKVENQSPYTLFGDDSLSMMLDGAPRTGNNGDYSILAYPFDGDTSASRDFSITCTRRRTEEVLIPPDFQFNREFLMEFVLRSRFQGASGYVSFGEEWGQERNPDPVALGAYAFSHTENNENATAHSYDTVLTSIYQKDLGGWEDVRNNKLWGVRFSAASGRSASDNNYLSKRLRWFAFFLVAIQWATAIFAMVVLLLFKSRDFLKEAQPLYLHIVCFGSMVMSSSILTLAWDEGMGLSTVLLSKLCIVSPWLFFLGQATVLASFNTMAWRLFLAKDLNSRTSLVAKKLLPLGVTLIIVCLVLCLWTFAYPLSWNRIDLNPSPLETYGVCQSKHQVAFLSVLIGAAIAAGGTVFYLSWKTIHNPAVGSIMYASYAQLQCWCFGLPMLVVLKFTSADGTFFGRVLIVWVCSMTAVVVVAGPRAVESLRQWDEQGPTFGKKPRMIMISAFDRASMADDASVEDSRHASSRYGMDIRS